MHTAEYTKKRIGVLPILFADELISNKKPVREEVVRLLFRQ